MRRWRVDRRDGAWVAAFVALCVALVAVKLTWFSSGHDAAPRATRPAPHIVITEPMPGGVLARVWGTRPAEPKRFTDPALVTPTAEIRRALAQAGSRQSWPDISNQVHLENVMGLLRACDDVGDITPVCVIEPSDGVDPHKVALLVGDATMQAYWMMLRPIFASRGWTIVDDALSSCSAALIRSSSSTACRQHRAAYARVLAHWKPSLVVMSDGEEALSDDTYAVGLVRAVSAAQRVGSRVMLLSPPPAQPSVMACQQKGRSPQECAQPPYPTWFALNATQRSVARRTGATYVDLLPFFCHHLLCPSIVPGNGSAIAVRGDYAHLTPEYAQFVEGSFARYLARAGIIRFGSPGA